MNPFTVLVESGALSPIDAELGALLTRRSTAALDGAAESKLVGMAAAMVSAERGRGHSCVDFTEMVRSTATWMEMTGEPASDAPEWRALLLRSGLCGDGTSVSPLVMDGERLYLYRYHAAERRLATAIRARLDAASQATPVGDDTVAFFRRLFPTTANTVTDWQSVAAAAAMRGGLTVVTGGPGTGKTTTVARIVALLLHQTPQLRIALAAPTGKASARLAESIRTAIATLPLSDGEVERIPTAGRTLHRLLGYRPWSDEFTYGPGNELADDVVIVDEASMVDVLMMDALFAALRTSTRVILLGDQDQLASVDTGYVLGDICRAADADGAIHGRSLADWHERLSGQRMASGTNELPLRDSVVRLVRSYRFESQPGIGALATAIRDHDATAVLRVLTDRAHPDVHLHGEVGAIDDLLAPVVADVDLYLSTTAPEQRLDRFAAFRVLCAVRDGPTGVAGLNERIESWLRTRGVNSRARWYDGKPVLVTANDPGSGLYNGDVGVTMVDSGQARIWFRDGVGKARSIAPARLPAHETAWAMTVHKAQGSEFDRVLLVLPQDDAQVLTRELLYTAVTRAQLRVDIFGTGEMLHRAMGRTTQRASGLADRLKR